MEDGREVKIETLDPRVEHDLTITKALFEANQFDTQLTWTEMRPRVIRRLNYKYGVGQ